LSAATEGANPNGQQVAISLTINLKPPLRYGAFAVLLGLVLVAPGVRSIYAPLKAGGSIRARKV